MNDFDFEELIADMLDISDEARDKDPELVFVEFGNKFEIDFYDAMKFAEALIPHTIPVKVGMSGKIVKGFTSKSLPVMLVKVEVGQ